MLVEIVWSTIAREELLDLYVTIGLENPAAADRIYDRIERRVSRLAEQPRMGQRRADIRAATRVLVEAPYLILYETVPDADDGPIKAVEIVNIVHGRRDPAQIASGIRDI